jgi:hypothetical protein
LYRSIKDYNKIFSDFFKIVIAQYFVRSIICETRYEALNEEEDKYSWNIQFQIVCISFPCNYHIKYIFLKPTNQYDCSQFHPTVICNVSILLMQGVQDDQLTKRSFEQDWALQGDIQSGINPVANADSGSPRMPRTNTLPQFKFNDPDFQYKDANIHPKEENKKIPKLQHTPPSAQDVRDPSQDKLDYLMKLGKIIRFVCCR